jgi:hypothetical protein
LRFPHGRSLHEFSENVHVCVRTDHRRVHAWLCLDGHNAAQERRWGSPVDIDRDTQVAPSKTNADDSEDGDTDDNLFSLAELVVRVRRLRTPEVIDLTGLPDDEVARPLSTS